MHKQKLNKAVLVSLILHIILLLALIIGAITRETRISSGLEGSSIDAIMVDQSILSQQQQRTQQQKQQAEKAAQERQKSLEEQEKLLQEEQAKRQERLKELEKERLDAEDNAKRATELKKQEEAAAQAAQKQKQAAEEEVRLQKEALAKEQQAIELARKKAEEEAKVKAQKAAEEKKLAEAKLKEAEEIKKKAEAEAAKVKAEADKQRKAAEEKKKAEQAAKAKAEKESKQKKNDLDNLFGDLASSKNDPNSGGGAPAAGQKDLDAYNRLITQAIQSKFKDPGIYRGKTCELAIKMAPDGLLLDVRYISGDSALCREAIVAAKLAVIPKPPSRAVYEKFKNATLEFSPGSR